MRIRPQTTRLALLTLSLLAGSARAAAPAQGPVAGVAPGLVDGPTAHRLVASGVKVVDVRTPAEYAAGHVPGALNIPHDQMAARHAEIGPPSTPVLLYCRTGHRTRIAAEALREKGFTTLYDLQAYDRWTASEPKR
ncbi:rhodanese-like domain-containing protein [Anaeromyxobacter paludicola]|uniref:Rhodanese domain-containing protein n=1 Tax=Anaeromyxobacter paludicola TaxID=2918171 RepID=A0ABM7XDQ0_9BACT|nr:rhodanese-like domain-containing protein [Anaeromyxobacter paludicola]BDG10006.1 hypothetical protein AMPC_31190 [Anaeromyxobacter paludicola]